MSHTGQIQYAWLDVDLASAQPVESVVVWNRTDCCADRLKDYWVFLSEEPFPASATPQELAQSPRVWSRRILSAPSPSQQVDVGGRSARYVRVQLSGNQPIEASFSHWQSSKCSAGLHQRRPTASNEIKVEGFNSNRANDVWIVFTTAKRCRLIICFLTILS